MFFEKNFWEKSLKEEQKMKNCFDKGFKNWVGAMLGSTDKWKMPKQIKSRPIITLLIVAWQEKQTK